MPDQPLTLPGQYPCQAAQKHQLQAEIIRPQSSRNVHSS